MQKGKTIEASPEAKEAAANNADAHYDCKPDDNDHDSGGTLMVQMPIEINRYTGKWQEALHPSAPDVGATVLTPSDHAPEGREMADFRRVLRGAGLDLEWYSTAEGWNEWTVVQEGEGR